MNEPGGAPWSRVEAGDQPYQSLFQEAFDSLCVLDLSGAVVDCNDSFAQLLGYTYKELLQLSVSDWDRRFSKDAEGQQLSLEHVLQDSETLLTTYLKKNGSTFDAEIKMKVVEIGGSQFVYISARKVTQDLALERRLSDEKKRFEVMFENSPDALMVMELDGGRITTCNTSTEKMLGGTRDEIIGLTPDQVSPEYQPCGNRSEDLVQDNIKKILEDGHFRFEWVHRRLNGEEFPCDVNISLVEYQARQVLLVGWRDMTYLKQQEERLRLANYELEQFAYRSSHDLKAPLVTIKGLTKFVEEDLESGDMPEVQKNVQRIFGQVNKLEKLVVDILDLAKADLQHQAYEVVDIADLLREIEESYADVLVEKGVDYLVEIPGDLKIYTQKTRLRHILANLIVNAVKYSDPKKEHRFVKIHCQIGSTISFSISDNGVGIRPEDQPKIFNIFTRFHAELSDGSGLGMSIVQKNLEALDGHIQVRSSEMGTTFDVVLPHVEEETENE